MRIGVSKGTHVEEMQLGQEKCSPTGRDEPFMGIGASKENILWTLRGSGVKRERTQKRCHSDTRDAASMEVMNPPCRGTDASIDITMH